jgi:hypothetical protein
LMATRIEDLFIENIELVYRKRNTPACIVMRNKLPVKNDEKPYKKFEKQVLNFLFENRKPFGIKKVYQTTNMLIDGAIILGGKLILLEMKYVLNWRNACVARVEVQRFVEEGLSDCICKGKTPRRAIIVFNDFGGDWKNKTIRLENEDGWYKFYEDEKPLREGTKMSPIDIAQLTNKGLITCKGEELKHDKQN